MPAYFSLSFELNKSSTAVKDFCVALIDAGLVFKCGFWGFENDSFDDIIEWNQEKLDDDFELGFTEHHSHDYKQMQFDYHEFSEVRLFIMNYKQLSTFRFELIIPEDDFLDYTEQGGKYVVNARAERMELIRDFAKKMWIRTEALAIQSAWECSDVPPLINKIKEGINPQAEPFCIIPNSVIKENDEWSFEEVERGGVLIERKDNWNYI